MSKKVLVIGDSMSLAHVTRAIMLARKLAKEGAEVIFATSKYHLHFLHNEDFQVKEIFCVNPEEALMLIRKGSHIFSYNVLEQYIDSDRKLLRDVKPDLVIGDMRPSLSISAELESVEYWSLLSAYLTKYYQAKLVSPKTLPINRIFGETLSDLLYPIVKPLFLKYYGYNFSKYRKNHGMKPINNILDALSSPYRNLLADYPVLHPCDNLPSHFEFIGPMLWEPTNLVPEWYDDIRSDKPTVYVSMGSTGDSIQYEKLIRKLVDMGWQILTTSGNMSLKIPGVYSAKFATGSLLLKKSQLLICHGGSGTIYQSIIEGVPLVGLSTFHDQEFNLQRVENLQWGTSLNPNGWRDNDLRSAIDKALSSQIQKSVKKGKVELKSYIDHMSNKEILIQKSIEKGKVDLKSNIDQLSNKEIL